MRLLLTNDDGYQALGLQALQQALITAGHHVTVVAPSANRSGTSCSLTLDRPIALHQLTGRVYHLDGTPADCVHVGLTGIAKVSDFDAVISGINDGANLGDDAIHSGTLGAATQAHLYGLPALASSLVAREWENLDTAVQITLTALNQLMAQPKPALWNLNVPNVRELPAIHFARVGRRTASKPVHAIPSPRGGQLFFLGAGGDTVPETGTDIAVIEQGYACISPVTLDRTDHNALSSFAVKR